MKTLVYPRRAMRPHPDLDSLPSSDCKWCGKEIGRGEIFPACKDLGHDAIVCATCLTPPAINEFPSELIVED